MASRLITNELNDNRVALGVVDVQVSVRAKRQGDERVVACMPAVYGPISMYWQSG
jgi:hypothetical protein